MGSRPEWFWLTLFLSAGIVGFAVVRILIHGHL